MTIFRFDFVVALALLTTGCERNMPARDLELGRILRLSCTQEADLALKTYVASFKDIEALRAELGRAGFTSTSFAGGCYEYLWSGSSGLLSFDKSARVTICNHKVQAILDPGAP